MDDDRDRRLVTMSVFADVAQHLRLRNAHSCLRSFSCRRGNRHEHTESLLFGLLQSSTCGILPIVERNEGKVVFRNHFECATKTGYRAMMFNYVQTSVVMEHEAIPILSVREPAGNC